MHQLRKLYYEDLAQKAEQTFWKKFEELRPRYQNIDMEKLRSIATEMFEGYLKFALQKRYSCDLYDEEQKGDNEHWAGMITAELAMQTSLAFAYYRLSGNEAFVANTITKERDYHYHASPEDCMNLGPQVAEVIFGSLFARIKDAVATEIGVFFKCDPAVLGYKEKKPRQTKLVASELCFGQSAIR